jgi:hypothetical protein
MGAGGGGMAAGIRDCSVRNLLSLAALHPRRFVSGLALLWMLSLFEGSRQEQCFVLEARGVAWGRELQRSVKVFEEFVEVDQSVERSGVGVSGGSSRTTEAGICRFS